MGIVKLSAEPTESSPKSLVLFFTIVDVHTLKKLTGLFTLGLMLRLLFIPIPLLECNLLVNKNVPYTFLVF